MTSSESLPHTEYTSNGDAIAIFKSDKLFDEDVFCFYASGYIEWKLRDLGPEIFIFEPMISEVSVLKKVQEVCSLNCDVFGMSFECPASVLRNIPTGPDMDLFKWWLLHAEDERQKMQNCQLEADVHFSLKSHLDQMKMNIEGLYKLHKHESEKSEARIMIPKHILLRPAIHPVLSNDKRFRFYMHVYFCYAP